VGTRANVEVVKNRNFSVPPGMETRFAGSSARSVVNILSEIFRPLSIWLLIKSLCWMLLGVRRCIAYSRTHRFKTQFV
jgi:hypothetical protein